VSDHLEPSVDPKTVRVIILAVLVVCAGWVLVDFGPIEKLLGLSHGGHGHDDHDDIPGYHLPGFYAAYGFVSCVLLVLAATQMRRFVKRDEDYYDD